MVDRASRLRRPCRRSLLSSDAPVPAATSRPTPPAGAPPLDSRILPPRAQVRILGSQCRSSPATAAKVPSRLVARGAPSPCGRRRRQPLPLHWRRPRLRAGELKRCDAPLLAGASASKRVPTGCTKGRFLTSLCCTGKNAVFVRFSFFSCCLADRIATRLQFSFPAVKDPGPTCHP
ncbi:hypothetical protein SETIT_1G037200v2 [Setaria italica]|uniref:Uncharacterized protein n=2 Tax=Setaria TaxID=4554 RepID=A0A368PHD0_SETIT|nr:hypothetical protein SETIT_1G037200v2 [Setaria italica]TKW37273.1 hypothetical protein SEVIR_1G036400v2 [Setaria viridis]